MLSYTIQPNWATIYITYFVYKLKVKVCYDTPTLCGKRIENFERPYDKLKINEKCHKKKNHIWAQMKFLTTNN